MAQEIVKSRKLNLFLLEEVKLFLQLIARRGRRGGLGLFIHVFKSIDSLQLVAG